jgi:hypothetical protein
LHSVPKSKDEKRWVSIDQGNFLEYSIGDNKLNPNLILKCKINKKMVSQAIPFYCKFLLLLRDMSMISH